MSGRAAYRDAREAIDDAVDMIELGAPRDQVLLEMSKLGINESQINARGIELGGPAFKANVNAGTVRELATDPDAVRIGSPEERPFIEQRAAVGVGRFGQRVGARAGQAFTGALAAGTGMTEGIAASLMRDQRRLEAAAPGQDIQDQLADLANVKNVSDVPGAIMRNPKGVAVMLAESLALTAPVVAAAGAGLPAAGLGAVAAGASGGLEFGSALSEVLDKRGISMLDVASVDRALKDPAFMSEVRERGALRGLTIGAIDGLTANFAGSFVEPALATIRAGKLTGKAADRAVAGAWAKELGFQMVAGGGGETAGQALTGEQKPLDIALEGLAEGIGAPVEAVSNVRAARRAGALAVDAAPLIEDMPATVLSEDQVARMGAYSAKAAAAQEAKGQGEEATPAAATPSVRSAPAPTESAAADAPIGVSAVPQGALADAASQALIDRARAAAPAPATKQTVSNEEVLARPVPASLPDDMGAMFEGGALVPIEDLVSTKVGRSGDNALRFMDAASRGEVPKRGPLIVVRREDGKLDVIDGNGTYAAASAVGLKQLPVLEFADRKLAQRVVVARQYMSTETANALAAELAVIPPKGARESTVTRQQREQVAETLAEVRKLAEQDKPQFDTSVNEVAALVGGKAVNPPIKGEDRTVEKAFQDYGGDVTKVRDVIRSTVEVQSLADVMRAVGEIYRRFDVVRLKDRITQPTEEGYRDILINVRTPSGGLGEIQVSVPSMLAAKEVGHALYRKTRSGGDEAEVSRLRDLQRRLYGDAYEAAKARVSQAGSDKAALPASAEKRGTGSPAAASSISSGDSTSAPSEDPVKGSPESAKTTEPSGNRTSGTPSTSSSTEPLGAVRKNTAASSSDGSSVPAESAEVRRVQGVVDKATKNWRNAPKVVVVQSVSDKRVPAEVRRHIAGQDAGGAKGKPRATFVEGDAVYVYADANPSERSVLEAVMHEVLGHHGLGGAFGSRLVEILNSVAQLYPGKVSKKAADYGLDMNDPAQRQEAAEEVLADLAQTQPNLTIVERAIAAIRSWLRANMPGFRGIEYSDAELVRNFILPARRFVEGDAGRPAQRRTRLKRAVSRDVGGYQVVDAPDGSIVVSGDQAEIRSLAPPDVRGRLVEEGVAYTAAQAPRVLAALEGADVQYGRAGEVTENARYTTGARKGQYIGAPDKYNTPAKIPHLRRLLSQLALEGEPGKMWYERSGETILKMVGGDRDEARKFISLLAIYSPQAKVDANSTFALRAWAQYKAGKPIKVKTGKQDRDATEVLYEGKQWGGEKTNNFFRNLMREVDANVGNAAKQGVTVDMWMMRAAGYDTDSPTQAAYRFVENETNRVARDLGWEPQQVQAAIWVAMKARLENTGVKQRTEAKSTAKGYMRYVDKTDPNTGKVKKVREVIDEAAHRQTWLDEALKLQVAEEDTNGAKFDFADGVRRHLGQISWEARPGRSTGVLPGVNDAPYHLQAEFQQAVAEALSGPNGEDLLAKQLGLLQDGRALAPGVWQSEVAAGMQSFVGMAPEAGGVETVDPAQAKQLNLYADILGLLLRQEGVGWHKPFFAANKRDQNGLDLDFGRPVTPLEMATLDQAIGREMDAIGAVDWRNDAAMIATDRGVRVVLFSGTDNTSFRGAVTAAAESLPKGVEITLRGFRSSGDLRTNNWVEQPNGEGYRQRISAAGRPDVLEWAERVLGPAVQAVFEDFSKRYGWGNPGTAGRAVATEAAPAVAQSADVGDPFASGYKALDGRLLTYEVRVADSGEVATVTVDAGQYLRELDQRVTTMRRIMECMR